MADNVEWVAVSRGDAIPDGAVLAGRTSGDGDIYVGRNGDGEVGKMLIGDDGTMYNLWCHDGGASQEGDVCVVQPGHPINWVKVARYGDLPADSVLCGNTGSDGDVYACRDSEGVVGKLNLADGKVEKIWYQGAWFSKTEGEILCVGAIPEVPEGESPEETPAGDGGYVPAEKPAPVPPPAEPPAPAAVDASLFYGDAQCGGAPASERVAWLVENKEMSEDDAKEALMREFPEVFAAAGAWQGSIMCDGVPAQQRAQWLVDNNGMSMADAREQVKGEFPGAFGGDWWDEDIDCGGARAGDRAQWLCDNKGLNMDAAKQQVRNEFPACFGGADDGDVIDCAFPHSMSVVQTPAGPKLKIAVTPANPGEVSLVAVHYVINGGSSMNFDINVPDSGKYVHVTPGGGYPACPAGASVSYWLSVKVNGGMQDCPEGACGDGNRMDWTAP